MNNPTPPEGWEDGNTIETVLLSVAIVHGQGSAGQLDDSCAHLLGKELIKYHGVSKVETEVLYRHTKRETHCKGCRCFYCTPRRKDGGV